MKSAGTSPTIYNTKEARADQVLLWIISGATDNQIQEAIASTWPDADSKPLIAGALQEIAKNGDLDRDLVRGWCFAATRDLYRRMVEIGDFTGALRAVNQIQELSGAG